jgi:hypothetical protein
MSIHCIAHVHRWGTPVFGIINMHHKLVPKKIEINPPLRTTTLSTTK